MVSGKFSVIDSHCHIYPQKIASKAVGGTDKFYGVTSCCSGTVEDLICRGKSAGVDKFIVQSVATTPKQVKSINEFIAGEVNLHKDVLTGLGTLHPDGDIEGDLEHLVGLGLHGVKLHPDIQNFKIDDYRCLKIYEQCEKRNIPILLHAGDKRYDNSNPNRLIPVIETYTQLTFIAAHFGGWSIWEQASKQLAGRKNLYVDCSSSLPYIDDKTAVEIIRRYGAEHVLFGTDYPMWDVKKELDRFMGLSLDDKEKECILSKNAISVFSIK